MGKRGPQPRYTPEDLEAAGNAFFDECDEKGEPYTICGLAIALGMTRKTLIAYEGRPETVNTIKKFKGRCEAYAERHLYKGRQVAGVIFSLKNNYGWKDKVDHGIDPNDLATAAELIFNPVRPDEKG